MLNSGFSNFVEIPKCFIKVKMTGPAKIKHLVQQNSLLSLFVTAWI